MFKKLRGLYWYYLNSERIILPFKKKDWKLLWNIANSWIYGHPDNMVFGGCWAFTHKESKKPDTMKEIINMLNYLYKRQCEYLSYYGYFPTGDKKILEFGPDDLSEYNNIGWKAAFEWRPPC
jgi:hypothetical protein